MNDSAKKIIDLLQTQEPASVSQLESLQKALEFKLPDDFLEFFRYSNGAYGEVPHGKHYVILWPVEEPLKTNKDYEVDKYAPGIFIFGSSGGGEGYGFDSRTSLLPVIQVPFVGMELKEVERLASSFTEFLKSLETGCTYG